MESRILALTEEAVGLHAQRKSKTLTPEESRKLRKDFEETMALKTYLETELAKQRFLQDTPSPPEELKLSPGPIGAGGGL